MSIITLLVLAIIVESVWETLKMTWQDGKVSIDRIGALVVALVVAIATNFDMLALVKVDSSIPFLGVILTGILLSRGSNFIHDLITKLGQATESKTE